MQNRFLSAEKALIGIFKWKPHPKTLLSFYWSTQNAWNMGIFIFLRCIHDREGWLSQEAGIRRLFCAWSFTTHCPVWWRPFWAGLEHGWMVADGAPCRPGQESGDFSGGQAGGQCSSPEQCPLGRLGVPLCVQIQTGESGRPPRTVSEYFSVGL